MFKYHIPKILFVLQYLQLFLCVFQDNINVFLKSCRETFGLGNNQLFDIGDLEDLSQRAIAE